MTQPLVPTIPTDEEMNRIFHEEVLRTVKAVATPLGEVLEKHKIGIGLPRRFAISVVLHSLLSLSISMARQSGLPKAAILDVIRMSTDTLNSLPDLNSD